MVRGNPIWQKLRRLHFSLRELLLLVVLVASLCGLFISRGQRQRRAVDAVRDLGGNVEHAIVHADGRLTPVPTIARGWRRWVFGERSARVASVDLSRTGVTDDDLQCMVPLVDMRELRLGQTQINGSGLNILKSMPWLETLDLANTGVTDASLDALRKLTRLKILDLRTTPVTDASLVFLGGLKQLRVLHLDNTHVGDAGLVHLRGCTNLCVLSLENTRVSLAGLTQLKDLTRLGNLKALGLDLTHDDLADTRELHKRLEYVSRVRVVSEPRLRNEILRAWKERQRTVSCFDIRVAGAETAGNTSTDFVRECAVDSRGRVRYTDVTFQPIELTRVTVFDGRTSHSLSDDPHGGAPREVEWLGRGTDWVRNRRSLPIALVFRPVPDLIAVSDFAVTRDRESIDGHHCVVAYHREGKIWIDVARDFIPLRFSFIRRGVTFEQFDISCRQDDTIGWVPAAWLHTIFNWNGDVMGRDDVTITKCVLNPRLSPDAFQVHQGTGTNTVRVPSGAVREEH